MMLKPCPFCGAEAKDVAMGGVVCSNRDCWLAYIDPQASPKQWNSRPVVHNRIKENEPR